MEIEAECPAQPAKLIAKAIKVHFFVQSIELILTGFAMP